MTGNTAFLSSIHNYFTPTCTFCRMKFNAVLIICPLLSLLVRLSPLLRFKLSGLEKT